MIDRSHPEPPSLDYGDAADADTALWVPPYFMPEEAREIHRQLIYGTAAHLKRDYQELLVVIDGCAFSPVMEAAAEATRHMVKSSRSGRFPGMLPRQWQTMANLQRDRRIQQMRVRSG